MSRNRALLALCTGAALAVVSSACGESTTPAGAGAGSTPTPTAPTPTPTPTPTTPTPTPTTPDRSYVGQPPSYDAYMACLRDPDTTLAECQRYNPNPTPTPTPTPTTPHNLGQSGTFVVGDCVVIVNSVRYGHDINGAYCTDTHAYRVDYVVPGANDTNACRKVDPTYATDSTEQFRDHTVAQTYCITPTAGSTGHQ